jgi:hypothetical protein
MSLQVICINASNKPKQIPDNKWVKEGEIYTILRLVRMNLQQNKLGIVLEEIELDESCFPYHYFDADRFSPVQLITKKEEVKEEDLMEV